MALLVAGALLAACGGSPTDAGATGPAAPAATDRLAGEVTVFAAASLTEAFTDLKAAFTAAHPEAEVAVSFAGSQTLATQITQGAPADVFASANPAQMEVVAQAGRVRGQPRTFARTRLAIAVEPGNPLAVDGLQDLAEPDLVVVLPAPTVPAGAYARRALARAGVEAAADSLAQSVREALSKVVLGEADAAVVYASDVLAAGDDVARVAIDEEANVTATYPIAVLNAGSNPAAAAAFVDFTDNEPARAVLAEHGFAAP